MNSPAACFNYFSLAQCFLSPSRPALHARLSRFSLDCVFSINQSGDRIFKGESSQREILVLPVSRPSCSLSSAKILAVDEILADIVWGGEGGGWGDDNKLLSRSPWGFDARGRLAAPRIENIEFQQTGKKPCRPLFYYRKLKFGYKYGNIFHTKVTNPFQTIFHFRPFDCS